jgi:hypothetical protein
MHAIRWLSLVSLFVALGCGGSSDHDHDDAGEHLTDGSVAEAGPVPGASSVGDSCTEASTCPAASSGTAACLTSGYPGGYCAVQGCSAHGHDCPGEATVSKCVLAPDATCLRLCEADADCRPGYVCAAAADAASHEPISVCIPG